MDNFFYNMNQKLKDVLAAPKSEHKQLNEGAVAEASTGDYSAKKARAGKDIGKPGKQFAKIAKSAGEKYGSKERGEKVAGAVLAKLRGKNESVEEGMFDSLKQGMAKAGSVAKKVGGKALSTLGHGDDTAMRKDLQRKMGMPQTGKKPMGEEYGPLESAPMTPKQKSFAKLAPPKDKITFADKIAGAKKEVDEVLGDVAAEAMKGALKGGQKKLDKNHNGKLDAQDFAMLRKGGKKETDEGSDWSNLGKEYSRPKIGSVERGAKHDIEHTATGRRVTRRTDDQGISVGTDDEAGASPEKRGRGRPKGSGKSIGAKGPSGKSKLMKREGEKELDEKAVSKKQQKFMGMVHAAQKGEKAASPEVAKVAKTMKKKDAEDFASTKHKGLPEKVKSKKSDDKKSEGKKKKTEEAGGSGTPTASSGFSYGKGIYDSLNREIENLIAESMSINASDSTEGGKSLTITATDEDALHLADVIRNAGLGGEGAPHAEPEGEIEVMGVDSPISGDEGHEHEEGECPTCGSHDCGCGDIEETLGENEPDWPTEPEMSDDAFQYSGGLNKPKSTGQTTVPVIAHQGDRTGVDDEELRRLREMAGILGEQEQVVAVEAKEEELDEAEEEEELDEGKQCSACESTPCKCEESVEESLAALRGLAGIQEAAKPDFTDVDKDGDEKESWKKAEQDKKDEEDKKVEESIFRMTNLWKSYKG